MSEGFEICQEKIRCYFEKWEKEHYHNKSSVSHIKLLSKYENMRYICPEGPNGKVYASVVLEDMLVWKDRKDKVGKEWGWHCVMIPKGITYHRDHLLDYALEPISPNNDFYVIVKL